MLKKTTFLISALCMLILANVLMMSYASPAFRPTAEGFASLVQDEEEGYRNKPDNRKKVSPACKKAHKNFEKTIKKFEMDKQNVVKNCSNTRPMGKAGMKKKEGFSNFSPGGAKGAYQPMGAFDGVKLPTGNKSSWRHTSPDEALRGNYPKFEVGPDNLFMFKDNQCKPSCCGASYACDGGCVCTTPEQRNFINMRGGNRTAPDAGV
jgi:hypothetical protein